MNWSLRDLKPQGAGRHDGRGATSQVQEGRGTGSGKESGEQERSPEGQQNEWKYEVSEGDREFFF
jgi:hypothetical protein